MCAVISGAVIAVLFVMYLLSGFWFVGMIIFHIPSWKCEQKAKEGVSLRERGHSFFYFEW